MGGSENFTCRPTSLAYRRGFRESLALQNNATNPTLLTYRSATRRTPRAGTARRASASVWATTRSSSNSPAPLRYNPHPAQLRPSPRLPRPLLLRPLRSPIPTSPRATRLQLPTTRLCPATARARPHLLPIHRTSSVLPLTRRSLALIPPPRCRSHRSPTTRRRVCM